jgi:rhodanese-related sulfurtransferase
MIALLKKIFGSGKNMQELIANGAQVIDVRTKSEYQGGHYKGSINIPLDTIEKKASTLKKDSTYVLCCRSGMRSGVATNKLKALGFTNVHNGGPWNSL